MSLQANVMRDIEQTLFRFFYHLDMGEYEKVTALLSNDCIWERQGKTLRSPAMALQALRGRPEGRTTLHVVTNLIIDAGGNDNNADTVLYLTAFRHDGDKKPTGPLPIELPFAAAIYRAKLNREPAGWRIQELRGQTVFKRED